MFLKTIATGSSGNCHVLVADSGEMLLLDIGVNEKEIMRGCNYKVTSLDGALVTHEHKDHSRSISVMDRWGVSVYAPYLSDKPMRIGNRWKIRSFDLTTLDGRWTHTNADGTECPCYGFLIEHEEMGRLLYITDTNMVKWRFKNINHILVGTNYDTDVLGDIDAKTRHVLKGHMSIQTACDFIRANNSDSLQNVIMCHLSSENADKDRFIDKMKNAVDMANVDVAEHGKSWILRKGVEPPF